MKKSCETLQETLLDVHYGEAPMTEELKDHMKNCPRCALFWADLGELAAFMDFPETADPLQPLVLSKILRGNASPIQKKRSLRDLVLFTTGSAAFLGSGLYLALSGHGERLMETYLFIFLVSPITLPFLAKQQMTREA